MVRVNPLFTDDLNNNITPYALILNAAELCFYLLRQQTEKQRTKNFEEIKVVGLLNQKDLSEYFSHCVEYNY